ncbi:MAG: hypothetical protein GXY41_10220 [Phycisphaerae bacterium]|nr:hypothetical protein [Phycisphaerae bacterium]
MKPTNFFEEAKFISCVPPEAQDNDDFVVNNAVDTLGLKELGFLVATGDLNAAIGSVAEASAICIEQSDEADDNYSDVTDAELSGPIADTESGKLYLIGVDLAKTHKRFMRVKSPHVGDGSASNSLLFIGALAVPDQTPLVAADAGLEERVLV